MDDLSTRLEARHSQLWLLLSTSSLLVWGWLFNEIFLHRENKREASTIIDAKLLSSKGTTLSNNLA